jgi:hypothetical protein
MVGDKREGGGGDSVTNYAVVIGRHSMTISSIPDSRNGLIIKGDDSRTRLRSKEFIVLETKTLFTAE